MARTLRLAIAAFITMLPVDHRTLDSDIRRSFLACNAEFGGPAIPTEREQAIAPGLPRPAPRPSRPGRTPAPKAAAVVRARSRSPAAASGSRYPPREVRRRLPRIGAPASSMRTCNASGADRRQRQRGVLRGGESLHRHLQPDARRLQYRLLADPQRQQRRAARRLGERRQVRRLRRGWQTHPAISAMTATRDCRLDVDAHRPRGRHRKRDQAIGMTEAGVGEVTGQPRAPAFIAIQRHVRRIQAQGSAQQQSMQRVGERQRVAIGGDAPSPNPFGFARTQHRERIGQPGPPVRAPPSARPRSTMATARPRPTHLRTRFAVHGSARSHRIDAAIPGPGPRTLLHLHAATQSASGYL